MIEVEVENSNKESKKSVIFKTKCSECIFSLQGEGVGQYGCQIQAYDDNNRIDVFEELGLLQNDGTFYEVQTVCNTFRKEDFLKEENPIESAIKQSTIQVDFIIIDYKSTISEIIKTLNYIEKQEIPPLNVIIVSKNDIPMNEIYISVEENFSKKFQLVKIYKEADFNDCIEEGVKKCEGTFYTVLEAGKTLSNDFIYKLNYRINMKLKPFIAIFNEPWNQHGFTTMVELHKNIKAIEPKVNIVNKMRDLIKEQNKENMVIHYDKL
jgi:hypothetical protein